MPSAKDLADAQAFHRRRLVNALVSGAPGGREAQPVRRARPVLTSAALAVLLVAGSMAVGAIADRPDTDWLHPGLVRSSTDGQNYLIVEGPGDALELRAVVNYASAQLLLGAEPEVEVVSEADLASLRRGSRLGIPGAPSQVPRVEGLIQNRWSACTGDRAGVRVTLAEQPPVQASPDAGLVVRSGAATYLLAEASEQHADGTRGTRQAYAYPLGRDSASLLVSLQIPTQQAIRVPQAWLDLFPTGGPLDATSIPIPAAGAPYVGTGAADLPQGSRVGDYYEVGDLRFVLTMDGAAELTDFARIVHTQTVRDAFVPVRLPLEAAPAVPIVDPPYSAARWPEATLAPLRGPACAWLGTDGEEPAVWLAANPSPGDGSPPRSPMLMDRVVGPGGGALVRSGEAAENDETMHLIDERGVVYEVQGPQAVTNLGFADVVAPLIPAAWLALFDPGPTLSVDAARCPESGGVDPDVQPCGQVSRR